MTFSGLKGYITGTWSKLAFKSYPTLSANVQRMDNLAQTCLKKNQYFCVILALLNEQKSVLGVYNIFPTPAVPEVVEKVRRKEQ